MVNMIKKGAKKRQPKRGHSKKAACLSVFSHISKILLLKSLKYDIFAENAEAYVYRFGVHVYR